MKMDIHKFFDEQVILGSRLQKERRRFTYDDIIAFAKVYAAAVEKNSNLQNVSNNEVAFCPHCWSKHVKKLANMYICLGCHGVFLQTDC